MVKKVLLLTFLLLASATCQKKNPELYFGSVSGNVIDGRTGAILPNVSITARDAAEAATVTGADGNYLISNIQATDHILRAVYTGYDTQDLPIQIVKDQVLTETNFVMLPSSYARGKVVIILTWSTSPSDLDSHLFVPNGDPFFEIDYGSLGDSTLTSDPFAALDLDDTSGTGPETTVIKLNGNQTYYSANYRFFVHNYSQEVPLTQSVAIVRVYMDGYLTKTYRVPTTGAGAYWHVFDLNGYNFTDFNIIQATVPSTP